MDPEPRPSSVTPEKSPIQSMNPTAENSFIDLLEYPSDGEKDETKKAGKNSLTTVNQD